MSFWQFGFNDLVLGVRCAGCGEPGLDWCRECAQLVTPDPVESEPGVWAAGYWRGRLRSTVLAWKLGQVARLDAVMAWHLAASVLASDPPESFSLVPVPDSWRSRRERGRHLMMVSASLAAEHLNHVGFDVRAENCVRLRRQTRDQSGLGPRSRALNVRGAMQLVQFPTQPVVVVDDIVTTGATLAEMKRVLHAGACEVHASAVIAASTRGSVSVAGTSH